MSLKINNPSKFRNNIIKKICVLVGDDIKAKNIEKTCNNSGYWINGSQRKCVGKWTRHKRSFMQRDQHSATCR